MTRPLTVLLVASALASSAPCWALTPTRTEVVAHAAAIAEHGCSGESGRVAGSKLGWARVGCSAFAAAAVVSVSLEASAADRAEAARLVDHLVDAALARDAQAPFRPTGRTSVAGRTLPRSVLYRGLLLLMLTGRERLEPGGPSTALMDALSDVLASDLARARWLPTYGTDSFWPCDHAPAAAALLLYGELRGSSHARAAGVALAERLTGLLERPSGFPTQVAPSGSAVQPMPRGTALAWTAAFLHHADPRSARRFAEVFVTGFCDRRIGLAACREWPRGVERRPDVASGPIVQGYGMGASALGLGATRALDEPDWHDALARASVAAGMDARLAAPREHALEVAMYLWTRTLRPWSSAHAVQGPDGGGAGTAE